MVETRQLKVAVLGSSGMLGTALEYVLRGYGHGVRAINRSEFEIGVDPIDSLDMSGYDYVVNAAGVINRRFSDQREHAQSFFVNSLFPHLLADRCEAKGVGFIHISTDCVFAGTHGPYGETDAASANDDYGRSKHLGEPRNCLVLRTSIIGPERERFYSLLCWFLSQTECRGYLNHRWNGMTSVQLSRCIHRLMQSGKYAHRVQHVHSEDTTKHDLLLLMNRIFKKAVRVVPWNDGEDRDTRLCSVDAAFVKDLHIPSLAEQLTELVPLCDGQGRWLPGLLEPHHQEPR